MAVVLADRLLGVKTRGVPGLDAYGDEATGQLGPLLGPWPGRVLPQPDGSWHLSLDPRAGALLVGDVVVEPSSGSEWTVLAADKLSNAAEPSLAYVRASARPRISGGMRPEGHP